MALCESRRRRQKRVMVRAAAVMVLLLIIIVPALRFRSRSAPVITVKRESPNSVASLPQPILITRIETDPHIVERLSISPRESHVIVIGDSELLRELAEAHQPAGLAYVNGKAMLLFR